MSEFDCFLLLLDNEMYNLNSLLSVEMFRDSGHTGMDWAVAGLQGRSGIAYVPGNTMKADSSLLFNT